MRFSNMSWKCFFINLLVWEFWVFLEGVCEIRLCKGSVRISLGGVFPFSWRERQEKSNLFSPSSFFLWGCQLLHRGVSELLKGVVEFATGDCLKKTCLGFFFRPCPNLSKHLAHACALGKNQCWKINLLFYILDLASIKPRLVPDGSTIN